MKRRDVWLWTLVLASPLAWAIDLNVSYAITPPAHGHDSVTGMYVLHGAAFAVALLAGIGSLLELRTATERRKLMAFVGVGFSLVAMLLVIGNVIPTVMLPPGAEP